MPRSLAAAAGCVLALACSASLFAQQKPPDLLVVRDGWGDDDAANVREVLRSAADELFRHFPDRELPPVVVYPKGGPIVLYQKGPGGEVFMRLDTGDRLWAQYVYQFSHEMCHVLCHYDGDDTGNDWFEESLCEVASLFVLRRLSQTWKKAENGNWRSFAPSLHGYAGDRLKTNNVPEGQSLADWYAAHRRLLHGTSTRRDLYQPIANHLLPLLEEAPERWLAITYLNHGQPGNPQSFEEYLGDWRRAAPEEHHAFIDRVAKEFGVAPK